MSNQLYLLKIRLLEIEPEIWRRFVVPGSITLDRLHDVIQIIMGWKDYHLHQFTIGNKIYTGSPESEEDGNDDGLFRMADLFKQKIGSFEYLYDFGDSWDHEIIIENSRYFNPELQSEVECLEGARACPPEDIGSVPGYYNFCQALKDPDHEDHERYKIWFAGFHWYDNIFVSEKFDIEIINYELMKYMQWARDRHQFWGFK